MTYKKKVNLTLQFFSEWFQINWLVLNKNKTPIINFSPAKTLTHTLNKIPDNQNLTLTESIKFLGMHLESYLSRKLHRELLKKLSTTCYMMRNLYYYLTLFTY